MAMAGDDIKKTFGRVLRRAREARGLSQERLAEAVGVSDDSIGNAERGLSIPRFEVVVELARALGVSVADFVPGAPKIAPDKVAAVQRRLERQLGDVARTLPEREVRLLVGVAKLLAAKDR